MGSYCPICDEFVENLDQCDLPYGGAPAPPYNTAIQDDEAEGEFDYGDDGQITGVDINMEGAAPRRQPREMEAAAPRRRVITEAPPPAAHRRQIRDV